jgi:circadian clock protein KaiC
MASERISTGIGGLDPLLGGGYILGRTYLVAGEAGSGKTIACLQFLVHALRRGERAVYVTVDERPVEILETSESFGWDLQHHIQEKTLVILDASPYFGGRSGGSGDKGVDPQKIVTDLGNYAKRLSATVLIIDPLTPLISPGDAASAPDQARALIQLLQSQLNVTTLFTAHESAGAANHRPGGVEQFLATGILLLKVTKTKYRLERFLTIKKMRGTAAEPCVLRFVIRPNEGIALVGRPDHRSPEPPMFELFDPANKVF